MVSNHSVAVIHINCDCMLETNQIVTLGLFHLLAQLIATLIQYPFIVLLPGLAG